MQPFCRATTLLSVLVSWWLLRMSEASTLTLIANVSYGLTSTSRPFWNIRADVVHDDGNPQTMLATQDMLK